MDRSRGYNRSARKLLHIVAGLLAFTLPFIPYWLALLAAIAGTTASYILKPTHAWWLRYISKPVDRHRGVITGLRGYATVVLLLILAWPLLSLLREDAVRYVMFGWLALALCDGSAGLIGPGPAEARTVFWNRHKTWWGLLGGFVGASVAYLLSFLWPPSMLADLSIVGVLGLAFGIGTVTALLESLQTPVDDNYLVGIGAPLLALLCNSFVN